MRREKEIIGYLPQERPTTWKLLLYAIQQVIVMFPATVTVALITGFQVSTTIFASGLATLCFILITGRKIPLYYGSSFAYLTAIASMVAAEGTAEQIAQFNSTGGAQAVSPQSQELFHILHGGDAAGSLDLAATVHALDHQFHIVEVGTCGGETGAGLDVVGTGLADDVAHRFLFLIGQQAGLDDDLQDLVAHSLLHGTDVLADGIVLLILQAADVDDHVHLRSAVFDGSLCLKGLAGGVHGTQREAHHAAHRDAACHVLHSLLDVAGVDADGCGVVGNGFVTQGLDLGPGGLRLQQGVIDMGENFFAGHVVVLLNSCWHGAPLPCRQRSGQWPLPTPLHR